jgi:hypothetical protein
MDRRSPPQLILSLSLLQKGKRELFTDTVFGECCAWSNGVTWADISCACVQKPAIAGGGAV